MKNHDQDKRAVQPDEPEVWPAGLQDIFAKYQIHVIHRGKPLAVISTEGLFAILNRHLQGPHVPEYREAARQASSVLQMRFNSAAVEKVNRIAGDAKLREELRTLAATLQHQIGLAREREAELQGALNHVRDSLNAALALLGEKP